MSNILELENVGYRYNKKKIVLDNINYEFENGKLYSITGKSGSGKTTLLSILSGLTLAKKGRVVFDGTDIRRIDRYNFRAQRVGVIFQSFNLLPHLTALENIIMSLDASGKRFELPKKQIAKEMLTKVDLDESYASTKILKLSGGEQQRVAIARALSYNPDIILADEPTGNLDGGTQDEIMTILKNLAHKDGKCVIVVTHSPEVAKQSDVVFKLEKPKFVA